MINGGVQESLEDMGAPEGTTFLVRNLFYNTPARSKFLKSDTNGGKLCQHFDGTAGIVPS